MQIETRLKMGELFSHTTLGTSQNALNFTSVPFTIVPQVGSLYYESIYVLHVLVVYYKSAATQL